MSLGDAVAIILAVKFGPCNNRFFQCNGLVNFILSAFKTRHKYLITQRFTSVLVFTLHLLGHNPFHFIWISQGVDLYLALIQYLQAQS